MTKQTLDQDLIELSGSVVYEHGLNVGQIVPVNECQYLIEDVEVDAETQFDAITVQNTETHEYSVIYQGTQDAHDIATDAMLPDGGIPEQFNQADAYYQEMNETYGVTSVAGNSLGGGMANYVAMQHEGLYSVTLNPAIIPSYNGYEKDPTNYITNYLTVYDPLTLAENAAGYGDRIPGKVTMLQAGLPWLEVAGKNHVGYNTIENGDGGQTETGYTIGEPGEVGYGTINISADDFLVADIWGLGKTTPGVGKKIDINADHLTELVAALDLKIIAQLDEAKGYLDQSVAIVASEGDHLNDRTQVLSWNFDQTITASSFNQLFPSSGVFDSERHEVLGLIIRAGDLASEVSTIPGIVLESVTELLNDARRILNRMPENLDHLVNACISIAQDGLLPLFHSVDNHFTDGIVEELDQHYQVIGQNNNKLREQTVNFRDQVHYVATAFTAADAALANGTAPDIMSGPASVEAFIEESPYLTTGMGFLETQLNTNYDEFTRVVYSALQPVLEDLVDLIKQVENLLEDALPLVRRANFALSHVPFTDKDEQWEASLEEIERYLTQAEPILGSLRSMLKNAEDDIDEILYAFKPYVETALFEGTRYHDVLQYNHAALNLLIITSDAFKETQYQLSNNSALAVDTLGNNAENVLSNLKRFIEEVERGTVG